MHDDNTAGSPDHNMAAETPAEELGRLRRELSELDYETPEHAATLDRISVLVRMAAEQRLRDRRAARAAVTGYDSSDAGQPTPPHGTPYVPEEEDTPLARLRARNAAAIAAGAEAITEQPTRELELEREELETFDVRADDDPRLRAACQTIARLRAERTPVAHLETLEHYGPKKLEETRAALEELAGVAVHALTREELRLTRKLEKLEAVRRPKYESLHAAELADTRRGLEATTRALAIARANDPVRRAILEKLGQ